MVLTPWLDPTIPRCCVVEIATPVHVFDANTRCEEIDRWFGASDERTDVVVETPGGPAALSRERFYQALAGSTGFGWALHYKRPIARLIDRPQRVFGANEHLEDVALAVMADRTMTAVLVRRDDGAIASVSLEVLALELAQLRQQQADALGAAQRRFRAVADAVSDIVMVIDADGSLRYVSPNGVRLYHDPLHQPIGRPAFEVVHPDEVTLAESALRKCIVYADREGRAEVRLPDGRGGWRRYVLTCRNLLADREVGAVVAGFVDITERHDLTEALRHQAFHDALTSLPNRALLFERAAHALARRSSLDRPVALVYLDLDGFKEINDAHGHLVGDAVLAECARRFASIVRAGDTVARIGGDEFLVLVEDHDDESSVAAMAERLVHCFDEPIECGEHWTFQLSCSAGVALMGGEPGGVEELVRRADVALYDAKARGKGRVRRWEPQLQASISRARRLRIDLRSAVERGQMWVAYQPLFATGDGGLIGAEALLRWDHPDLGPVSPGEFIPLAEGAGLVDRLGSWVLERACSAVATWRASVPELFVTVNVSALQLDEAFPDVVARALAAHGVPGEALELEITESTLAGGLGVDRLLRRLRGLGVRLAIDDFGTGYSALTQLRRLPIDTMKLDRSFVERLADDDGDRLLVEGIVRLAHTLRLTVTAEGVETIEQLDEVRALGCDRVQGFLLGRPVPARAIGDAIAERGVGVGSPELR
jgi:diguanylate cyclase (GGDEF)-like protein/PAS domain S-box-containing protein